MKAKYGILIILLIVLSSCKNDPEKKRNLIDKNEKETTKNNDDNNRFLKSRDTINFMINYIYNFNEKKKGYLKDENVICSFKDSTELKNVASSSIQKINDNLSDDEINFDETFFIDFDSFTLSFISNYESEMYCQFKKTMLSENIYLINIYMNDNIITCIIDNKFKRYQLISGESILLDNFLIISDNGIDVSTIKILEIIENSIICKNKVFSTEESFYGFTLENQTLNFYSNNPLGVIK